MDTPAGRTPGNTRTLAFGGSIFKFLYNIFNVLLMLILVFSFIYNIFQANNETQEFEIRGLTDITRKIEKVFHVLSGIYERIDKQEQKIDSIANICVINREKQTSPPQEPTVQIPTVDEERLSKIERGLKYLIDKEKQSVLETFEF